MFEMRQRSVFAALFLVFCTLWVEIRCAFLYSKLDATSLGQEEAVVDLIGRLLPDRADEFVISVNESLVVPGVGLDKFIISSLGLKVGITGSSGVAAANGFHYYLKHYCSCHVSWSGNQLRVPVLLPQPKAPEEVVLKERLRYYQNVCTASYSELWWDWTRWEKEIDWMALNGINFALAFNGQELIWKRVFLEMGLTEEEMDAYFTGPAFLAWHRMGNIQGLYGPLSDEWIQQQADLQKKILTRMRSLGISTILPAFAGHVPSNITRVYPNASVALLPLWSHFNSSYSRTTLLQPSDPLFEKIGTTFVQMYVAEFGTDHYYNTDLFNEMAPTSNDTDYLRVCGEAVFNSLTKGDPEATWVMQGWLFYSELYFWGKPQAKALLTSVPLGKLIVLDLYSDVFPQYERLDGYFGQPFIWCMLHNFGGVLGMYGALDMGVAAARKSYSNMIGIGLTPEGIEQNDVMYDFMLERTWTGFEPDINSWITAYSIRRYGVEDQNATKGWQLLRRSVYSVTLPIDNHGQYIIVGRPSLRRYAHIWYKASDVYDAWGLFVAASGNPLLGNVETFQYDLVDLSRQSLQIMFSSYYGKLIYAYHVKNETQVDEISTQMLNILNDMEMILSTDRHFLLGNWIKSARSQASNEEEKTAFEFMAKNQITLWGPSGEILDYATKQWAGVVSDYYTLRWKLFFEALRESIEEKTPLNQTLFNERVFEEVETPFTRSGKVYPVQPQGESALVAQKLYNKYKDIF